MIRMSQFPLYDQLAQRGQLVHFDPEKWTDISMTINQFNEDQLRVLYGLILHHANINGVSTITSRPPYKGKAVKNRKGIKYNIEDLPAELKKIVGMYVLMSTQ